MSEDALFPTAAALPTKQGAVLATFRKLVAAAETDGKLVAEDAALIEGTAVLAEALDTAHRVGGLKGGYLAVQALPPFQRALHALRLPVELTAVSQPATAPEPASGTPDWFSEHFGTAE